MVNDWKIHKNVYIWHKSIFIMPEQARNKSVRTALFKLQQDIITIFNMNTCNLIVSITFIMSESSKTFTAKLHF